MENTRVTRLLNEVKSLVKVGISHMDYCLYGKGKLDREYLRGYATAIRETAEEIERELA